MHACRSAKLNKLPLIEASCMSSQDVCDVTKGKVQLEQQDELASQTDGAVYVSVGFLSQPCHCLVRDQPTEREYPRLKSVLVSGGMRLLRSCADSRLFVTTTCSRPRRTQNHYQTVSGLLWMQCTLYCSTWISMKCSNIWANKWVERLEK